MIIQLNTRSPKINSKELKNNKLHLEMNDGYEDYKVTISKTKDNQYIWNDGDIFIRHFSTIDSMMWEFELPHELESWIKKIPNLSDDQEDFTGEKVFDYKPHKDLSNLISLLSSYREPFRKTKTPGRNDHCPCGSRRKFKKCCMKS